MGARLLLVALRKNIAQARHIRGIIAFGGAQLPDE
jgi:hypothetical protein